MADTKGWEYLCLPNTNAFLERNIDLESFKSDTNTLSRFIQLDDYDIWASVKSWSHEVDPILSYLSNSLLNRNLYKIKLGNEPYTEHKEKLVKQLIKKGKSKAELPYYVSEGSISNAAYMAHNQKIKLLKKNGKVVDIEETADLPNIKAMSKTVTKYYLCWPRELSSKWAIWIKFAV